MRKLFMNFLTLHYFLAVARERSITRAAGQLHITQQTLSGQMAALERELDCSLFLRTVPLKLTYAGELFLRYATDFCKKEQTMRRQFQELSGQQAGLLRIGIAYSRELALMPELLRRYRTERPQVTVELFEQTNDTLVQMLLAGELDLAVAQFPQQLPGVKTADLYTEQLLFLAARSLLDRLYGAGVPELLRALGQDTAQLARLADCPFLLSSRPDIAGRLARQLLSAAGVEPCAAVESGNIATLLSLCAAGEGACCGPDRLVACTLTPAQQDSLYQVPLPGIRYPIQLGWPAQLDSWQVLQSFVQLAQRLYGGG